jgi:hypothetical protein
MRTSVLVLGILGVVFSLMVGICTGVCFAAAGSVSEDLGATDAGTEGQEIGAEFILLGLGQAIVGLLGTVMAYRSFEKSSVKIVPVICLVVAMIFSMFNIVQFFTSGLLFGVAVLLIFLGGGKTAPVDSGQDSE